MDFSKIVEVFDNHSTSFVSITQHFNTTTSMGRLTLNILLSFAQFEREVTGERIRDKFAASAKKGLWITGATPLGYKKDNGALVEDTEQSWKIQTIFGKYLELKSVAKLKFYLDENEVHTRSDKKFSKGNLYHLLSNKVYIGKITKDNNIYEGKHDAIISTEIFEQVQKLLQANSICTPTTKRKSSNALLQGKIFDDKGNCFSPSRSTGRGGKIYNYYINQGIKQGKYDKTQCLTRIPAKQIEDFVFNELNTFIHNTKSMQKIIANKPLNLQAKLLTNLQNFEFNRDSMRNVLSKVIIDNNCTELLLSKNKLYELITSETSFSKDENISLKFNIKITQCSQKGNTMLKAPGVAGLKVVPTATSNSSAKSATNEKYQKEYQAKLAEQSKKLEAVKSYDKAARLELANVILTSEQITEIKGLSGEEQDVKLNEALAATLSDETFALDFNNIKSFQYKVIN